MQKSLARDTSGNVLALFAAAVPVILVACSLAVDITYDYFLRSRMQHVSDMAALSAAQTYAQKPTQDLNEDARYVANSSGFDLARGGSITVSTPPSSGQYAGVKDYVEVNFQYPHSNFFRKIFSSSQGNLAVRSLVKTTRTGSACIQALEPSDSGSFSVSGGSSVDAENCNIYVNSSSSAALTATGGSVISAKSAYVVGRISLSSSATLQTTDETKENYMITPDILASVPQPTFSGCDKNNFSVSTSVTLNPGVYCNGLTLSSGANVTLNPGVYIIDRGKFTVNGGATLTGVGVTIYLTSTKGASQIADVTINGSSVVNISAPISGDTAGIAFFTDRSSPKSLKNTFNGGNAMSINGAVYAPGSIISWSGSANTTADCTMLIARNMIFTGNAHFTSYCEGFDQPALSVINTLVE